MCNKVFHVVQNIPSPYRLHLFTEMHRQLSERNMEFHVHFMSDMSRGHEDRPLSWRNPKIDFPHTYWRDYGVKCHHFNPGLIHYLRKVRPDYLLVGSPFDTFTSIAVAFTCHAKVRCTWSEGNTKTPGVMTGIKGWIKRLVFSKYDYVGVPGSDAARYITMHQEHTNRRMPKPVMLPNLIDEKRFKPRTEWREDEIEAVRENLGISKSERMALTPARLAPVKGLLEYISLLTSKMLKGWKIVILGQGALKDSLLQLAEERGLRNSIIIKDFVAYSEMPKYYAAADLFVLPSLHDPNPLSVVEALHSGLPVAVSEKAGNVEEAVNEMRNGWILPICDQGELGAKLTEIFATPVEKLRKMGELSYNENATFWRTSDSVSKFLGEIV